MKKTLLISTALLLTACGSTTPNLVHTTKPILNVEAQLENHLETQVKPDFTSIKNVGAEPLNMAYYLYWYDKNGVTQPFNQTAEYQHSRLVLQPKQAVNIPLVKPTAESHQYRLYLGSK